MRLCMLAMYSVCADFVVVKIISRLRSIYMYIKPSSNGRVDRHTHRQHSTNKKFGIRAHFLCISRLSRSTNGWFWCENQYVRIFLLQTNENFFGSCKIHEGWWPAIGCWITTMAKNSRLPPSFTHKNCSSQILSPVQRRFFCAVRHKDNGTFSQQRWKKHFITNSPPSEQTEEKRNPNYILRHRDRVRNSPFTLVEFNAHNYSV